MNNNYSIRLKVAKELAGMSEKMIRRLPPFDHLPILPQFTSHIYEKYISYCIEIDDLLKDKIINYQIDLAHYLINMSLGLSGGSSFNEMYPKHLLTEKEFEEWINKKEGKREQFFQKIPLEDIKFKVNKEIKRIIKDRFPDYLYYKKLTTPSVVSFSSKILEDNKIIIAFDKGTYRRFIAVYIGIEAPDFLMDIARFFAGTQSQLKFNSNDELITQLNISSDYLNLIIPHFIKAVEQALIE